MNTIYRGTYLKFIFVYIDSC